MTDFLSLHDDIYQASCRDVLESAFYLVNSDFGTLEKEMTTTLMSVFTDKEFPLDKKTLIAQAVASLAKYNSSGTSSTLRKSQLFQSTLLTLIKEDGEGSSPALVAAYRNLLSHLNPPAEQKTED